MNYDTNIIMEISYGYTIGDLSLEEAVQSICQEVGLSEDIAEIFLRNLTRTNLIQFPVSERAEVKSCN